MTPRRVIETYEALEALTERMAVAARAAEWDQLTELEASCRPLVAELQSGASPELPAPDLQRKKELILRILDRDAEIRRLVEPRLATLEHMLHSFRNQRRLDNAYGHPAA